MLRLRAVRPPTVHRCVRRINHAPSVIVRSFSSCLYVKNEGSSASNTYHKQGITEDEGFDSSKKYSITQCTSCGIPIQTTNVDEVGFYVEPKKAGRVRTHRSKNLQFVSALSKIDDEGRKLLGISFDNYGSEPRHIEQEDEKLVCKRCHDALHHSVFKVEEHLPMKYQQVIDSIPKSANILQVFSAYDFPLSLVRVKARSDVTYVMNKTDLLFGHGSTSAKHRDYFNIMVERLTGSSNKPMIISAYTNWGVSELFKKLGPLNYMVGFVNAGKTRLCNRLINFARQTKTPGSKMLKSEGSSHLPALTRDNIVHECLDKMVVDVPGFLEEDGVFKHLKEAQLKHVLEGKKLVVSDLRDAKYFTVKGGNCLSYGGIFFMIPPKDSILQIKSICQGEHYIFKDLEKAVEVVKNPPEALAQYVQVKPESMDDLVRYVIPPFVGTIDLVVKDVGYIQIKPTGVKKNDELFEVWAPRGVVLGVRETIEHFLTRYMKQVKTKDKKVRQKDRSVRIDKVQRLKMEPKEVPEYNIFSKLYEISKDSSNPKEEMIVQYEEHLKDHKSTYHRWRASDRRDTTKNKYWIEKL